MRRSQQYDRQLGWFHSICWMQLLDQGRFRRIVVIEHVKGPLRPVRGCGSIQGGETGNHRARGARRQMRPEQRAAAGFILAATPILAACPACHIWMCRHWPDFPALQHIIRPHYAYLE
jgi:hypothetical protein